MEENILYVLVGLPRSGKSTWAARERVRTGAAVVNLDSIRLALHGQRFIASAESFVMSIAKTMVRALFLAGHTKVILDATNVSKGRRAAWFGDLWRVLFVHIDTPAEVCRLRATRGLDNKILPVIDRMVKEFDPIEEEHVTVSATIPAISHTSSETC
jgi:predicted kinase